MLLFKVLGIILAVIALLIAAVLILPVDLLLRVDRAEGMKFGVGILGIKFWPKAGGAPKPEKKKKPESPLMKKIKKIFGISKLESADGTGRSAEKQGVAETIRETAEMVKLWLGRLIWLVKRCKVQKCRIVSVSGGEDAPLEYGVACAVLYPLAAYLQNNLRVRQRGMKMDIRCDYTLEESRFTLELAVRLRVIHAVRAVIYVISKNTEEALAQEE